MRISLRQCAFFLGGGVMPKHPITSFAASGHPSISAKAHRPELIPDTTRSNPSC